MDPEVLAERIRNACLEALLQAYEDAGVQGLCAEGRWEAAVGARRQLDLTLLLRDLQHVGRLIGPVSIALTEESPFVNLGLSGVTLRVSHDNCRLILFFEPGDSHDEWNSKYQAHPWALER